MRYYCSGSVNGRPAFHKEPSDADRKSLTPNAGRAQTAARLMQLALTSPLRTWAADIADAMRNPGLNEPIPDLTVHPAFPHEEIAAARENADLRRQLLSAIVGLWSVPPSCP